MSAQIVGGTVSPSQYLTINPQVGTTYTVASTDQNNVLVELSNTSPITVTVPADGTTNFPIGTQINLLSVNSGIVTVAGAVGVTVNGTPGLKLRAQWSPATIIKRAANTWVLVGDLSS